MRRKPHSQWTKEKMRRAAFQRFRNPQERRKIAVAMSRKHQSPETIAKRIAHFVKTWEVKHPDGHKEIITNLTEFGRKHNVAIQNLSRYGYSKGFEARCLTPHKY